jgi:hypothetical protein
MDREQFTVTCDSHVGLNFFPTNKGDDFIIPLPRELNLASRDWEVGMQNITFPIDLADAYEGDAYVEIGGVRKTFPRLSEYSNTELVQEIQRFIETRSELLGRIYFGPINGLKKKRNLFPKAYRAHWLSATRKAEDILLYHRAAKKNTPPSDGVDIKFSKLLCHVLGEYVNPHVEDFEIRLQPEQEVWFEERVDVSSARLNNFLLYCDVVKPNIIGDGLAPLLQVIPIDQDLAGECMYEPKEIIFHPLAKDSFNSIEFKMRTAHGKKLCNSHKGVQIGLVFRKRNT